MAIKQVGIKNSQGEYVYTDIGVNSSNVDMTSGNSLQTDFSALQTQVGTKANASDLAAKQDIMQYSTMPTASAANLGKIVQYVGTTTSNYTNGYFYRSAEGDTAGTYTWEVVSGGGVETMHEAQYQQLKADYPDPLSGKGVYDPDRYFFIDDIDLNGWIKTNPQTYIANDNVTTLTFLHNSIKTNSLIRIVAEASDTESMPATGNNEVTPIQAKVVWQDNGSCQIKFDMQPVNTKFWLLIRNFDGVEDQIDYVPNDQGRYSTNEIVVGQWIDGKPIYRKVIQIANLPNATDVLYPHGISNIDAKWVASGSYFEEISTHYNNTVPGLGVPKTSANGDIQVVLEPYNIIIRTARDYSDWKGIIVIEYTKTTD